MTQDVSATFARRNRKRQVNIDVGLDEASPTYGLQATDTPLNS